MPTITENPVTLHAFCPDGSCIGYLTREVDGIAREVSRTAFEEAGPGTVNGNVVSTSFMQYLVPSGEVDEHGQSIAAELECEHCGRAMQVSPEPRPEYANMSNQDPMALLNRRKEAERAVNRDVELAELRGMVQALTSQQVKAPRSKAKAPPVDEVLDGPEAG
jgi:hypothetical protein